MHRLQLEPAGRSTTFPRAGLVAPHSRQGRVERLSLVSTSSMCGSRIAFLPLVVRCPRPSGA